MCPLIWLRVNLPGLHKGLPASFAQLRSLYQRLFATIAYLNRTAHPLFACAAKFARVKHLGPETRTARSGRKVGSFALPPAYQVRK